MKKCLGRAAAAVAAVLCAFGIYKLAIWSDSPTEPRLAEEPFTGSTECPEGLSLEVTRVYPGAVTFQITNDTGREYSTIGKQFSLQYDNGAWYDVYWKEGINTTAELSVRRLETREETLWVGDFYGTLPAGHYRIIDGVYPDQDSALTADGEGICPDFYLAGEFTVR